MAIRLILLTSLASAALLASAIAAHADYVVLRSGARLNVTGYEILGDKYRIHLKGGVVEGSVDDIVVIEPEEIFEPLPEPLSEKTPFQKIIRAAAERYGVNADLIHCVIAVESNFNPKAVSPKKARGLMQLLPQTAAQLGVKDIFDPEQNVDGGTRYLRDLLKKYSTLTLALAAYNAGPQRVDQYGRHVPPYLETMKYVQRIAKSYAKIKADAEQQRLKTSASWAAWRAPNTKTASEERFASRVLHRVTTWGSYRSFELWIRRRLQGRVLWCAGIRRILRLAGGWIVALGRRRIGINRPRSNGSNTTRYNRYLPGNIASSAGDGVERGIPDEFKQAIVRGFVIPQDRFLIDLASHADDVSAHNCLRLICRGNIVRRARLIVGALSGTTRVSTRI